jgi:hypothetical protein
MPLTDPEKAACRRHLGYLGVSSAASLQFGLPKPTETLFIVELAMQQVLEIHVGDVRDLLAKLDTTEQQIFDAQILLAAERLGEITIRADQIDRLQDSYRIWANRLADILGVPLYAYSEKFKSYNAYGSIPVRH